MGKYYPTAFSLFLVSVGLATATGNECQFVLIERCMQAYREDLSDIVEKVGAHCFRMKKVVTFLVSEPECTGELIEKFRYLTLQMAMMGKILGTCKDIDYTALKSIVQETEVGKSHRYMEDVEYDDIADACALTVHKECVRYFLSLLVKDRKMCEDAEKLNKCYDSYSKSINCNAKIIRNYATMVEGVGDSVVQLMENYMKSQCNSASEL